MKVIVSFKTNDVLDPTLEDLEPKEQTMLKRVAGRYIEYEENINIEFDLETGEATVLRK